MVALLQDSVSVEPISIQIKATERIEKLLSNIKMTDYSLLYIFSTLAKVVI